MLRHILQLLVFTFLLLMLLYSCSYDNEEEYYGSIECDSINVTFSETIDPIISRNCKSCHYEGNGTGITLATYNNIQTVAESGKLLGALKHLPGYDPMPQGGNKLDDCTLSKIETWVNDGTPNN